MSNEPSGMLKPALIFLGAGAGGLLRYWLGSWVQVLVGTAFPAGTLVVNVSGCLAVGFLAALFAGPVPVREEFRAAVLIGVLGGYTTFSSFGKETMTLIAAGRWTFAALNIFMSNTLGLAGVWAGGAVAARWHGTGAP